eukprot:5100659-Prymnesium_polylepis.1
MAWCGRAVTLSVGLAFCGSKSTCGSRQETKTTSNATGRHVPGGRNHSIRPHLPAGQGSGADDCRSHQKPIGLPQ